MVPMDMIIAALVVSCIGCNAAMYIALMYKRLSETYFLMVYACFKDPTTCGLTLRGISK